METNLIALQDEELLERTRVLVAEERKVTLAVLHHLREIEARRLFAARGFPSLFEFATRELGYTEAAAQRRISSMRLLKEIPEVAEKVQAGALTLTAIAQAQTYFRQEAKADHRLTTDEKKEVLAKLEGKSTRSCQRELAAISSNPAKLQPDRVRPVTAELSEVRFIANEELLKNLERLRELLAHKNAALSMAELLTEISRVALERLDPVREPKRSVAAPAVAAPVARRIPAAIRREVYRRDQGRCGYVDPATGRACGSRFGLEVDHAIPYAHGGTSNVENLRLRCQVHNQWHAIEAFGRDKIGRYVAL